MTAQKQLNHRHRFSKYDALPDCRVCRCGATRTYAGCVSGPERQQKEEA